MKPTLTPIWHKSENRIGYKLGIEGVNKVLFMGQNELRELQTLITDVLEDDRARVRT